jgi:hypothetical protein
MVIPFFVSDEYKKEFGGIRATAGAMLYLSDVHAPVTHVARDAVRHVDRAYNLRSIDSRILCVGNDAIVIIIAIAFFDNHHALIDRALAATSDKNQYIRHDHRSLSSFQKKSSAVFARPPAQWIRCCCKDEYW